jgi:hypothetical protein
MEILMNILIHYFEFNMYFNYIINLIPCLVNQKDTQDPHTTIIRNETSNRN